jgi:hypothetical protein
MWTPTLSVLCQGAEKQRCCSALQLITKPKISSIREMRIRHTINFSCVIPLAANRAAGAGDTDQA